MKRRRKPRRLLRLALWLGLALPSAVALAQQAPDAGRLLEQNRPPPGPPPAESPDLDLRPPEAPPETAPGGPRLRVERLTITGATRFPETELHALVADAEGRELTLAELRERAARITRHYRAHGYLLARAYLPAQTVRGGTVEIAIVEGRLAAVDVKNRANLRGAALAPLESLADGDPARAGELERKLLLLSDLPGTKVQSTLRPGATAGTSDLLVDVEAGRRLAGSLDADNHGDRYSGRKRLGGNVQWNNPLRLGDQASLRLSGSENALAYGRLAYQLPVSSHGTRVGLAASWMRYELGEELAPLEATGNARTASAYLLHPIVRSRGFNLNAQVQADQVKLHDQIAAAAVDSKKRLNRVIAGVSGEFRDNLGGGASNRFALTYTAGRLKLDAETAAIDAATAQTAGAYGKWNLSWQRLQRLTDNTSLHISALGQFAQQNLDSSEKLWLGGPNAVRAYPQGDGAGDQGYLLTLEARRQLPTDWPGQWQLTAFLDHGQVRINKHPWTATDNTRNLTGAGLGLNLSYAPDWTIRSALAWRIGEATVASGNGHGPRFWVLVVREF